jgi:O-6-methylguanine DNA methyltransferase
MTDFEKKVLRVVLKIPLGEVRTYKWVAQKIGKPKAYRAVANALKKNQFTIFVPCHRVVAKTGDYGGYNLGKNLKKDLINLEKKIKDMIQ